MRATALAKFIPFLVRCGEGDFFELYMDSKKIVTTAIGCALFHVSDAIALAWVLASDMISPASSTEVQTAWAIVTSRTDLVGKGGGAFRGLTSIRLTQTSHDALIAQRIATFEADVVTSFPNYPDVPDEAQEGLMRLTWATGGADFAARWPKFSAAYRIGAWAICENECRINGLSGEPDANTYEADLFAVLVATQSSILPPPSTPSVP